jgi:D-glycero-alpha-D-manno-heptose-7-phosphate kinase
VIITRTPFRVSFFGGGTDYPVWYREHGGATLVTAIDKYCYITCRHLPPFFRHKSRIAYTRIETVADNAHIEHPAVRAVLQHMGIDAGVEIHYDADLPARTGLGTSSAFTVGLLMAVYALQGRLVTAEQLARTAIYVEQELLKEAVGCQDQIIAAHGGFLRLTIRTDGSFSAAPLTLSRDYLAGFQSHLLLTFTGTARTASEVSPEQIRNTPRLGRELARMAELVDEGIRMLADQRDLRGFGELLDVGWQIKRGLSSRITNGDIDDVYARGRAAGAWGGKLLGAGGGGFLLFFAPPDAHANIRRALPELMHIPIKISNSGASVVFYNQDGASAADAVGGSR